MGETQVIMPQMGESIFEGTITQWLKKEGDRVERDEPLFEISTDKVDSEIPSPEAGTLKQILIGEGETVEINTVVAVITTEGKADAPAGRPARKSGTSGISGHASEGGSAPSPAPNVEPDDRIASSPMVRRLAGEHDIDLGDLRHKGTGAGGRITKRDILSYIEQQEDDSTPGAPATAAPGPDALERVPMSQMRKTIAEHMVLSRRTSAHVATVFEVDCSAILRVQDEMRAESERSGVRLTVSAFFVRAVAQSLKKFPILNSSVEDDAVLLKKAIHVGVAVALDDGLLVPVIRDADRKDLRALASKMNDLATRARTKKLTPAEVQGGTFTVTNPGNFGGLYGIPIINQPQVAILAIGGIEKRPVVVGDAIAIRPMVYLALSFDHRVIDGAVADQFMAEVKRVLENWTV